MLRNPSQPLESCLTYIDPVILAQESQVILL